jgi:hypothetical protein
MGAVAACIRRDHNTDTSSPSSSSSSAGCQVAAVVDFPPLEGQAFCFLPLPVRTQLPLHINAYFELSSNRRDIWRGDDTTGESKIRGQWNDMLLRDVLAPLYGLLLSRAVLYTTRQTQQLTGATQMDSALLFTGNSVEEAARSEAYLVKLLEKRRESSAILRLLPSPPPPEPWNILSSALLPLLRNTEVILILHYFFL